MFWLFFSFLVAGSMVVVTSLVSSSACSIRGRRLGARVSAEYFWWGLGLAYGLWLIFLVLALFYYDAKISTGPLGYNLQGSYDVQLSDSYRSPRPWIWFLVVLMPVVCAIYWVHGFRQKNSCKPLWQVVAIFVIAFASVPAIYCLARLLQGL